MAVNPLETNWSPDRNWFWDGLKWNDAVSADARWRFDGTAWQPFGGRRSVMPASPLTTVAPPRAELPSWVAPSELERLRREQTEREERARAAATAAAQAPDQGASALGGVGQSLSLSWAGARMSFGLAGTVLKELGILGSLVVFGMVVNTIVAVTRPIGGSHWVVPWATLVMVALRAWRGRWLAAGIIAVTWMLAVVVLFASGRA